MEIKTKTNKNNKKKNKLQNNSTNIPLTINHAINDFTNVIETNKEKCNIILTIDVGLKNLAMCIMDNNNKIYLWDVYNILEKEDVSSQQCHGINIKTKKQCSTKCQYYLPPSYNKINSQDKLYSCKKHFPNELKESQKKYIIKEKKVTEYLLQDIANKIMNSIDTIYTANKDIFNTVTNICIELQPRINQRMKFTSHIIYAKFVDLYKLSIPIRFIRPSQNLGAYNGPLVECKLKNAYSKRKFLSIEYVKWYLQHDLLNNEFNKDKKWLEYLLTHSKKDDLCDVVNANLNVHNGLSKKQKRNKNGSEIK
jgi:hypothetical protein